MINQIKNVWDSLSDKYFKSIDVDKNSDFAYEKLVNSISLLSMCSNSGNALDLGCGDGRFTQKLLSIYKNVYAVDYSTKMITRAKTLCPNASFIKSDLEHEFPTFDTKFDLIVCKLLLMYIKNIENIAKESYQVLKPDGILLISVTHPLKWISESLKSETKSINYKGYLSEVEIDGKIAGDDNLKLKFINRTFENYINTFTKNGFLLDTIVETGVPDSFVIKYPSYLEFQKKPYRLNMRFIKK